MNVLSRVRRVNRAFAAAAMVSSMILLAGGLTLAGPAGAEQQSAPVPGPPASWAGAWTSGQQALTGTGFADQTLRLLVHPTLGGSVLRIRLANTFGGSDQTFDAVSVAVATSAATADLVPGSVRTVRFGGATSVTIAAGARAISDPISLAVKYGQTLAVDLYVSSTGPGAVTGHVSAGQESFTATGNQVGEPTGTAFTGQLSSWYWLDGVDVRSARGASGSVVALGDSLTDGAYSSYNGNKRWTDDLAARLQALPGSRSVGVLNEGIGGNRVLAFRGDCCGNGTSESALARLDRDAIAQTGARTLIIADGINDIGYNAAAPALIQGLNQLVVQAKSAGLTVIGATITPYGCPGGCFGPAQEATRQAVNVWIRTSGAFDGVVDFDRAVADPTQPSRVSPTYDAGDHLHLNDSGYAALAAAIDLRLLR